MELNRRTIDLDTMFYVICSCVKLKHLLMHCLLVFCTLIECFRASCSIMAAEPLQHLTEQSAGVCTWMLRIAQEPRDTEYSWKKNGKANTGRKLEFVLVSEDSTQYCVGLYKRSGKEPKASQDLQAAKERFLKDTIWQVSKVALAKQAPKYLGCSCKVVIDMNISKFTPVLQSTLSMPRQATPPEDLTTLLECSEYQVVDVIALVTQVSEAVERTTPYGDRLKVDVTIMDDSGNNGAASCSFVTWFPKSYKRGEVDQLAKLLEAARDKTPVAFFNLVTHKEKSLDGASEQTTLKMGRDNFAFELCKEGSKASRLTANAATVLAAEPSEITVVTELPPFLREDRDYLSIDSTLTVVRLLQYTMKAGPAGR